MAQVLFGQSYFLRFDEKLWEAMRPYPPLGTLYACSHLRRLGFDVALFDAMLADSTEEWDQALKAFAPRYAVLYEDSFNYLSKMCLLKMREAAFEMLAMARRRGCTVIVSGSDATDHSDEYFAAGAHFVINGEGEISLGELVTALSKGDRDSVPGIAGVAAPRFRSPDRPPIRDLDRLPFPAWDLVDLEKYRQVWLSRHGHHSVNMVTTRGCPYPCNWCAKPIYGRTYHCRTPENVVQEMVWLKELVNPDHINFCDDIFGLKPHWIERFSGLLQERGLRIPFKCLLRTDLVDETIARSLGRAGCKTVWMGVESGSQKVLDAMDKKATVEDTYRATRLLRDAGVEVAYFLQFGYPGEDWDDILSTFRLVRAGMPDDIGISVAYPLPGTVFFERVRAELGENRNWIDSADLAMLHRGPYPTEFYRQLHKTLHQEFRGRLAMRSLREGNLGGVRSLVGMATLPLNWAKLQWMRNWYER